MKKFLVVLTILVLVAGFAFADISGKVVAEYDFNFAKASADGKTDATALGVGYTKPDTSYIDASFSLDSQSAGLTGENMPYAVVEVKASISGYYGWSDEHAFDAETKKLNFTLKLATFKIVGEDWEVNLLNAKGAKADFAVSAIDSKTFHKYLIEQNTAYYSYSKFMHYTDGVTVTYKGFVAGIGFNNYDLKNEKSEITFEVLSPEFTFGDVTVQAGAGYSQGKVVGTTSGLAKAAGASAKVAYATDDVKASVAVDAGRVTGNKKIQFDLAANVTVAPVTADVYYTNTTTVAVSSKKDLAGNPTARAYLTELLSAKVVVALGDVVESVPVKLTFTGKDLLKKNADYTSWSVAANTTAIENFDITLTVGGLQAKEALNVKAEAKYTGIENTTLEGSVGYTFDSKLLGLQFDAEYTAEKYTAEGSVAFATDFKDSFFGFGAAVETDKIVDGATLRAELYGVDFGMTLNKTYKVQDAGLCLTCTVEF